MKQIILLILVALPFVTTAQNTTYFMERLPQKISFNPAFVPEMDFYLGLPGIGGVTGSLYNSGFNYNELDYFINNLSDPNYNADNFVNGIGDFNRFIADVQVNVLTFGFRTKRDGYFSFNITANNTTNFRTDSDIAYLLADVDEIQDEDFPIEIDGVDLNTNIYWTYSVTYSRKINENLTLGISPKLNFNQFGIETENIGYRIEMEETAYEKEYTQYPLGEVLLGMPVEINPEAVNGNELDLARGLFADNWTEDFTLRDIHRNTSFTLDLGATYNFRKWMFSASLLNIGTSTWRTYGSLLNGNNDVVQISEEEKVRIGIPAKIYLGAVRQFHPRWNYGLMLSNTFFNSGSVPSATVSLNGYAGKMLSTSISYTAGYKFNNIGLGFRLRFFPGFDLFMVTDNILQAMNYKNAHRLSGAFGINFALGVNDEFETPDDEIEL
jgi:hypothetical protein